VHTEGKIISGHILKKQEENQNNQQAENENIDMSEGAKELSAGQKAKLISLYDEWLADTCDLLQNFSKGTKIKKNSVLSIIDKILLVCPENKNFFLSIAQERETTEYLFAHSLNMAIISVIIGAGLKYNNANLRLLGVAAYFADIGMFKIPKHIREKQVALTQADIQLIKTHPIHSNKMLQNYGQFPEIIAEVVMQVHENFDGTGYPQGKKGDEIHEYAKIISIADTFDAMTKKRSFRQEKIPHNIMKEMLKLVEKKFDPKIMRVFLSTMAIYPIGSMVQLNTKELGLVIDINEASPLKPKVKILYDSQLKKVNNEDIKIIDLMKNEEYKIIGVINPKALGISIVDEI
ncbi:MAG TPA: HD domain-containing phosphohydrolase, partial [bacterium]|nr:HD domain-containing phosphohydrolase [bacterium]